MKKQKRIDGKIYNHHKNIPSRYRSWKDREVNHLKGLGYLVRVLPAIIGTVAVFQIWKRNK